MLHAATIAADIAAGRVRPIEILEKAEQVFREQEPEVQAFEKADFAAARRHAPAFRGPLAGLPFAAKDNLDTKLFPTRHGSAVYESNRPSEDAESIRLARQQGGALVGKTAMTEFALFRSSKTCNPHDRSRTPGGSSSGSAAAVAAGTVAFAFGTQTAGSIIRPAAFCGVAGFKPTFETLPTVGLKIIAPSLDTIGLLAASVADVAFVMSSLLDQNMVPPNLNRPIRIGVCRSWADLTPSPDAIAALELAANAAQEAGASVYKMELPEIAEPAHHSQNIVMAYETALSLAFEYEHHAARLSARLLDFLSKGRAISPQAFEVAKGEIARAAASLSAIFDSFDIIMTPSAPDVAPKGLQDTGSSGFNRLWTALGWPTVNVPGLVSDSGLPVGIQIIGPAKEDTSTLAAATFVEGAIKNRAVLLGH